MTGYIGATGYTQYEERFQDIEGNISYISKDLYIGNYSITSNLNRVIHTSSNIFSNLYIGDNCITSNIIKIFTREGITYDDLYIGDNSFASNIKYLKNEVQNETQATPKTTIYRVKQLETKFDEFSSGYAGGNLFNIDTGALIGNSISGALAAIGASTLFVGQAAGVWYAIGACATAAQAGQTTASAAASTAGDALVKANKSLGIWDEDGNNTYNMKSGNVAIGILPKGTLLNNKLEVNGSINIPTNSKYKINNVPLSYSDLAGTPPVSSKWTNATDVATNIYYSTGNVGIGVTSLINNKLEVGGSINIPTGSKYKINNIDLSYNDLTNKLTAGTNISIVSGAINNTYTYTLPTAGVGSGGTLGGVKVDGSTINITNGVISAAAGTPQVNSDWTQTNDNLKSFIQNKPTAGNNISFANNTITNTITGSTTQNIIGLNTNQLIVVDKPNSEKIDEAFVPLTNEPSITSPVFTETIRTFTHSGGTEAQTPYDIIIGQNTICDILVIAGGGGGGNSISGGGGAGGMVIVSGVSLSGVYTINVGKGGINGVSAEDGGSDGKNSEIFSGTSYDTATNKIRAIGGGGGGHMFDDAAFDNGNNGGCGGGGKTAVATTTTISLGGNVTPAVKSGIFSSGVSYGNAGGNGSIQALPGNNEGGGGGGGCGINKVGGTGLFRANADTSVSLGGKGGDGLYVGDIFGTNIGVSGWVGGGGGGGSFSTLSFGSFQDNTGGQGGGGRGGRDYSGGPQQATAGVDGTGGGGGGGSYDKNGSKGGSGIVIIRFKTIVNAAIPEGNPITHKTLNFTYDLTKYAEYLAQQKTGVGGWRIVRFLPPNLNRWYQGDYISTSTFTIPTIGTPYNYTNEWAVSFGTFDEMVFGTFNMNYWLRCLKTSVLGTYSNTARPIISSSFSSTPYSANWYNRAGEPVDPWISIQNFPTQVVYGENQTNGSLNLISIDGGMCVLVRDSTASTTMSNPNQYTLSVPLTGTGVIINNTTLQYLSAGNYTISVGATQSSVVIAGIGQVGSDPYPSQNGSTITFKYSMTQKTQAITYYKKDGLIKYVPASGTNPTTGTWQMFDVDSQALTQFAGNLPFTRIDGNLPASKLDPIDMSKVSTGQLPISRTDGNLPASRLDAIDMSKVSTGNLYYTRISDSHLLVNERFHRIIYAWENVVDTQGVWTNKFLVNTNLHLNYYNQSYNYYQYYLSLSPNNTTDRHKYWFGTVKYSFKSGTDSVGITTSYSIISNSSTNFEIKETTSSSGVFWLNIWIYTAGYCESMLCTLH